MGHGHGALKNIQFKLAERRSKRSEKRKGKIGVRRRKTEYNFAKVSEIELDKIKRDIREKIKIRKRNELLLFVAIVIIIIVFATYFLS